MDPKIVELVGALQRLSDANIEGISRGMRKPVVVAGGRPRKYQRIDLVQTGRTRELCKVTLDNGDVLVKGKICGHIDEVLLRPGALLKLEACYA